METIAKFQETEISQILGPTISAFLPLLQAKQDYIHEIPKKTFQYGETSRHQLDVYYPLKPHESGKTPILFFIYGGGYVTGERILLPSDNLVYACVGSYFAHRGFVTVIPDYRLVPNVKYPAPAEDVRDAMIWAVQNSPLLATDRVPSPDINSLFLMGHSAGAAHAATTILDPELLLSTNLEPRIKGVILASAPYHLNPEGLDAQTRQVIEWYWGSEEQARQKTPLSLLENASEEKISSSPEIVIVEAEREPDFLLVVGKNFHEALAKRQGKPVAKISGKGHNHISLNWALTTGEGEEWAEEVIEWIRLRLSARPSEEIKEI